MFKILTYKKPIEVVAFNSIRINENFLVDLDTFHTKACKDFMFLGKFHDVLTNQILKQVLIAGSIFFTFIFMVKVLISDNTPPVQFFISATFIILITLSLPLISRFYYFKKYKNRVKFHLLEALNSSFGKRNATNLQFFLSVLFENENMTFNDLTASSWKRSFCETLNQEETLDALLPSFAGSLNDLKVIINELS